MARHPVLGPLPTSDANSALQRESLAALAAILPHDRIILRDERVDDLGVDASLELVDSEKGTNCRAQLQLKGRRGLIPGKNGALSLSVSTDNINYLLNGNCPVYVLYRPEVRELRYAFARDEVERIERDTPGWRDQDSITIHFLHVLDASSLQSIGDRLMSEARLHRLIHDKLAPLHDLVWGVEKIRDWLNAALSERLAGSRPEDVQAPPAHIAGPVLLQLSFCATQEQLREMYANLLASAMRRHSADEVHPAFTQIVQQLSPDEAVILNKIAALPHQFRLSERVDDCGAHVDGPDGEHISAQYERFCVDARVGHPKLSDSYLDNLLRLKLLSEETWAEGLYQPKRWTDHGAVQASVRNITGRAIRLSAFGEQFLRVCARSK
ncbi:Abi-alpha family protein [Polyangium sp. 6x1]|uniref:Abi-alpha family protein n=1 Tax=Polyangium sp. 6x1 TaxID=3042689 RepID=UPI002482934A|nr:Abi-alpha family protein [Polyangium sp. 6x1]MDI1450790.1 Abi-alpha family protein [Polyangium sp. 6x1]